MAANRKQSMAEAFATVWSRGGIKGFYQGLIPWVSALVASKELVFGHGSDLEGWRAGGHDCWQSEPARLGRDRPPGSPAVPSSDAELQLQLALQL